MQNAKRAYRTAKYWADFDAVMNSQFPTDSLVRIRSRNHAVVEVKLVSDSRRGHRDVLNLISGKQYRIKSDSVLNVTGLDVEQLRQKAQQHKIAVVSQQPIILRDDAQARHMPLTADEMILHTTLSATTKALKRVRATTSIRNPKLHDLVLAATSCLETCLHELEAYDRLPIDA